jgi:single-stranded-DNA-specific exonuclease
VKFQGTDKYKINTDITKYILEKRGIKDVHHYLNTTDEDINSFLLFGEDNLKSAATALISAIDNNKTCFVLVDCDCDGYTASAFLLNYLYELFPTWVEQNVKYFLHDSKQHGLSDCIELALQYDLVICPDSSSNDFEYHKRLKDAGIPCIVLDHHEAEKISEDAIIINNWLCDYPNKELSGVGVVWQFCRYLDSLINVDYADKFLDLVAVGLVGDMMSLTSIETKHLVNKGFKQIRNPFIYNMAKKNSYSLGGEITPIGCAFYIVPFINAMTRSGTLEEKELLFNSMLTFKAFEKILSNKRGHKLGEMEDLVTQALRCVTNVKARQTKKQDEGMASLESTIQDNKMTEHKALIFYTDKNDSSIQIEPTLRGLVANKIMAKYQRPCAILTRHKESNKDAYSGSMRGYTKSGIENFKDICNNFEHTIYCEGHQSAAGLSVEADYKDEFIEYLDNVLADVGTEPVYYCDIVYTNKDIEGNDILTIADMAPLWGQDVDEPYVGVKELQVSKDMVTIYSKKDNTIKISIPDTNISIMKFKATEEECLLLQEDGYKTLNIVGRCNMNEWNGNVSPQIIVEDYEIVSSCKYVF